MPGLKERLTVFITFDYKCPQCGHREPRFVRRSEMDEQTCGKHLGLVPLTRLPPATRTTFRFADSRLKD